MEYLNVICDSVIKYSEELERQQKLRERLENSRALTERPDEVVGNSRRQSLLQVPINVNNSSLAVSLDIVGGLSRHNFDNRRLESTIHAELPNGMNLSFSNPITNDEELIETIEKGVNLFKLCATVYNSLSNAEENQRQF